MAFQANRDPQKTRKNIVEAMDENSRDYNAGIAKAKACLETAQFREYAQSFEKTAADIIDLMLEIPIIDPVEFAFQMNELRSRLKSLRALGFAVNTRALLEPRKLPAKKEPPKEGVK